ncbi:MAG: M23 family metallopeptidase [Muribaculaceae bacterium]|nr:M23 family metallopeptidase [Muribaculaceae bacterium]
MLSRKYFVVLTLIIAAIPLIAQNIVSKSPHSQLHKELLAKQATHADEQIQLVEHYTFIDLLEEDLEPEPDIYTEGWNSKSVNPFNEADVPDTQVIDVTGHFMPCPGYVTSNYGYRRKFGRMHKGIDLKIERNDTIYAAFDGKVRLTAYERKGYGYYIIIRHPNGLETVYGHLNKHLVKPDQVVRAGDPIALGGSTGRSTGPHLHFETRFMGYAINPSAIFDFDNQTTHTDTYTFSKKDFTKPRNYDPRKSTVAKKSSKKKK